MASEPRDTYNPTQTVEPTVGAPNDYATVHADSGSFGGQVAAATEGLGQKVQQAGQDTFNTAMQFQGQLNEIAATKGEADLAELQGNIKSEYQSKEGLEAVAAHPDYVQKLRDAQDQVMGTMPNVAAKRSFAMLTARSTAYGIRDMGDYAATQFKIAQKRSTTAGLNLAQDQAGDPAVANDPQRFADVQQSIKFYAQKSLQDDGMVPVGADGKPSVDDKGDIVFPDTPAGNQAKVMYDNTISTEMGKAYVEKYKTLLNDPQTGADKAWTDFQQNRDDIPPQATAQILAMIRPRVIDSQTRGIADSVIAGVHNGYQATLSGSQPSTGGIAATNQANNNPGNLRVPGSTTQFQQFATPAAGLQAIDHQLGLYVSRGNNTISGMISTYAPPGDHNNTPAYIAAVSQRTGIDPNKPISSTDIPKIRDAIVQVETGGRAPGKSTNGQPPTNQNGGFMSQADYFRTHLDDVLSQARQRATTAGLEPMAVDQAVSRTYTEVQKVISQQDLSDRANVDLVQRAINGDLSNGQKPVTEQELMNISPDVKQAYQTVQMRDPFSASNVVNRMLPNNAKGNAKDYGPQFWKYYDGIESGHITNPTQLIAGAGPGLSNVGIQVLNKEMANRNTPEGQAASTAQYNFLKQLHNNATGQSMFPGTQSATLEQNFVKQLPAVLQAIQFAKANNVPQAKMFDPNDPNYVGNAFEMPDPEKVLKEASKSNLYKFPGTQTSSIDTAKGNNDLLAMIKNKQITPIQARQFALKKGWVVEAPPVPGAHDND